MKGLCVAKIFYLEWVISLEEVLIINRMQEEVPESRNLQMRFNVNIRR